MFLSKEALHLVELPSRSGRRLKNTKTAPPKDHRVLGNLSPSSRPSPKNCFKVPDNLVLGLKKTVGVGTRPKTPLPFKAWSILEIGGRPIELGSEQQAVEELGLYLGEGFWKG